MSLATTKPRVGLAVSSHPVLRPARACRTTICRSGPADTHVSRRESLSLLIALPLFASTGAAQAVDLGDFRKVKQNLDSLDQARADDQDYSKRFSFQNGQGDNLSIEDHKKRAKESFDRLQKDVKIAIDDKAYPRVSADIRHQLGTLRFDLKRVASAQVDKTARKQALQVQKAAFDSLADLDFAARKKSDSKLQETFAETVKRFGDVISSLG